MSDHLTTGNKYFSRFLVIISFLFCFLLLPSQGHTGETVSAKYTSISKNKVVLTINIGKPAPSNLIVQHFHPTNSKLTNSSPRASKVNVKKGFAKWFLKNVRSGSMSFSLVFNNAVSKNSIRTIIRYRDPVAGNFIETEVHP